MFNIVTLCTKNYISALNFSLTSWVENSGAEHIYIYSDYDIPGLPKTVTCINKLKPVKKWIHGVGKKPWIVRDFFNETDNFFIFLDADCYITKPIDIIVDKLKSAGADIGATRVNKTGISASCGMIPIRHTDRSRKFVYLWQKECRALAEKYIAAHKGSKHREAHDQKSFHNIVHSQLKSNNSLFTVLPLSGTLFNCEDNKNDKFIFKIKISKPYIIHFKGNRYLNKDFVQKAFKVYSKE
jgi:hypothetical protein